MKPAPTSRETGWLPDFVYTGETFEAGLAFFANDIGRITRFSREPADLAAARRLEGQAALPGLVNGHSQALRRLDRGTVTKADAFALPAEDVYDAARMAFLEMLLSGITCVGECGALPSQSEESMHAILRAARDVGIRIALFHGATAAKPFIREMDALRTHVATEHSGDEIWLGASVPDPGALPPGELKEIGAYAHAQRYRLQIALPSTAVEVERFHAQHGCSPVQLIAAQGLLDKRVTVIHPGAVSADDAQRLGAARALVCTCPLTGTSSGMPSTSIDTLRAAGADVALGTSDQVRTNILEAARLLPEGGTATARMHAATVAGARSLGAPSGALEVGRPADFFTAFLYDPSIAGASPKGLLDAILYAAERRAVREVWVGGRARVTNGRHVQQGPIVGRFVDLQRRRSS